MPTIKKSAFESTSNSISELKHGLNGLTASKKLSVIDSAAAKVVASAVSVASGLQGNNSPEIRAARREALAISESAKSIRDAIRNNELRSSSSVRRAGLGMRERLSNISNTMSLSSVIEDECDAELDKNVSELSTSISASIRNGRVVFDRLDDAALRKQLKNIRDSVDLPELHGKPYAVTTIPVVPIFESAFDFSRQLAEKLHLPVVSIDGYSIILDQTCLCIDKARAETLFADVKVVEKHKPSQKIELPARLVSFMRESGIMFDEDANGKPLPMTLKELGQISRSTELDEKQRKILKAFVDQLKLKADPSDGFDAPKAKHSGDSVYDAAYAVLERINAHTKEHGGTQMAFVSDEHTSIPGFAGLAVFWMMPTKKAISFTSSMKIKGWSIP